MRSARPIPTGSARRHAPNARSSACDGAGAYGPDAWATGLWPNAAQSPDTCRAQAGTTPESAAELA